MHKYLRTLSIATVFIAGISVIHITLQGVGEDAVRALIAGTARLSAFLFCLAFGASSLNYLFKDPVSGLLLKFRPHIGLVFGVSHTFHLGFLIWLQNAIHPVFTLAKTTSLIGGGLAYVLMYLMMLTTFPALKEMLSKKSWQKLHLIGGYWIWLIFFRSYVRKVLNEQEGYVLVLLLAGIMMFRLLRAFLRWRGKSLVIQ